MNDKNKERTNIHSLENFNQADFFRNKLKSQNPINIVAAVYVESDYYVLDTTPFSEGPIFRIHKKYVELQPLKVVEFLGEQNQLFHVSINREAEVLKQEMLNTDVFIDWQGHSPEILSSDSLSTARPWSYSLSTSGSTRYQIYAPPKPFWGQWEPVAAYSARTSWTINVTPIGDTIVAGEVRYYGGDDKSPTLIIESFSTETSVVTASVYATVDIRLQGVPLGTSCFVDVSYP